MIETDEVFICWQKIWSILEAACHRRNMPMWPKQNMKLILMVVSGVSVVMMMEEMAVTLILISVNKNMMLLIAVMIIPSAVI